MMIMMMKDEHRDAREIYGTFAEDADVRSAPGGEQQDVAEATKQRMRRMAGLGVCALVFSALLLFAVTDGEQNLGVVGPATKTDAETGDEGDGGATTGEARSFSINLREHPLLSSYFEENLQRWPASQVLPEILHFTVRDDLVMGDGSMGSQLLEGYDIIALNSGVFHTNQITTAVLLAVDLNGNVVNAFVPNNVTLKVDRTDYLGHVESIHMVTPTMAVFMQKGLTGVVWTWDLLTDDYAAYYADLCNGHDAQILVNKEELVCVANAGLATYDMAGATHGDTLTLKSEWTVRDSYATVVQQTGIHDYTLRTDPHLNRVTYADEGNTAYLSSRDDNSIIKLNTGTGEIEWMLGGVENQFAVHDVDGTLVDHTRKGELFYGQHNVEVRSDNKIVMFNNNRNPPSQTAHDSGSELLILTLDEDSMVARCVWKYELDFLSTIYGDADLLINGNVLATGWTETVYPEKRDNADLAATETGIANDFKAPSYFQGFETNWIEVTPEGETAMHIGVVARDQNEDDPSVEVQDGQSDVISQYFTLEDDDGGVLRTYHSAPVGYAAFSTSRFYLAPLSGNFALSDDRSALSFDVFNSHRTTLRAQGSASLVYRDLSSGDGDSNSDLYLDEATFNFGGLWVAETVTVSLKALTAEMEAALCDGTAQLSVEVTNVEAASAYNGVASVILCDGTISQVHHSKRANKVYSGSVLNAFVQRDSY